MKQLAKFIYFKLMGWNLKGNFPDLKKYVIMVVPHTSWHDFYMGLLLRRIAGININYVAKKELFKKPYGWYFKWMGGAPLDRTPGQNKVQTIASIFDKHKEFKLALAPEGTRKKVDNWKTGFYYIAKEAKVPIVMVAFDYSKKEMKIAKPFSPTSDIEADFKEMKKFFIGVVGKIPEHT